MSISIHIKDGNSIETELLLAINAISNKFSLNNNSMSMAVNNISPFFLKHFTRGKAVRNIIGGGFDVLPALLAIKVDI